MDHLPFPVDPALPPVVIPYVCEGYEPYDNHGFPTFAVRQGWMPVAHESNWCRCPADVAAVRAQTWLYFGLLHEFFGDAYDRALFVLNDTVTLQPVVTTQNLPRLLERWFDRTSQHRKTPDTKIRNLLLHAERYSQPLDALVPSAKAISLSIKVLICSLGAAAGIVNSGIRKEETFNASPSRLLDERMLENNWCPYWVRIYSARYSVPTINYLSALTRITMVEDHGSCTTNQCVAHNVNMQHYQTKHATTSCQCNFVGPSIDKIGSLIQEGIVPLVRCTELSDGRIVLDVIEADPGVEYTAISHVWSGGLGNPSSNSLPECQLRRLTQRMQNIARVESEWFWFRLIERAFKYVKVPFKSRLKSILLSCGIRTTSVSRVVFWLDTLCVPTSLEHDDLQRKAIDQMAFVYAGADRVLVLDPELQNINIRNLPNEQVCAYLACCAWRSRCWPYQEGRLARERVYLVADDIYHHSVGLRQIVGVNRDIKNRRVMQRDKHLVHSAVASFWEDMDSVKMVADKRGYSSDFTETWNGVSLRSTTKSEDLHSILAVLLGLSSREVLSLPLQMRTKAVFQAQDSLPLALLYLPSGPKILDIKNKWIPQYPSGLLTLRYGTMRQSVDGEVLTFSVSESLSCGFLVNSAYPFYQHFCLIDDTSSEKVWIQLKGDRDRELETLYHGSLVCYVLYNHLAGNQLVSSSRDFVGARFYFSKFDEFGTVHLVYDCPLNYYYQHPLDTSEDLLEFEYSEVQGQRLRSDTSFALDCRIPPSCKLQYRRPKASRLEVWRNIYTAPAIIFVMVVWCPCLVIWSLGVFGKGVGFYSTAVPALCTAFVRANIGRYLELPLLIETYKRLERKEWSASLDTRKDTISRKLSYSPDNGPLYQYRPQWIAGVITFTGCVLLVLGFPLHQYSARILGAILIIETIPRVLVELLWRRTWVGEFGRRFAHRWLHRIYWEADNSRLSQELGFQYRHVS